MSELLDNETTFQAQNTTSRNFVYPLKMTFKIGTLANDFVMKDANGSTVNYVRQKMFKFVDEIQVFSNESKSELCYTIKANKWIDFSASYMFTDANGNKLGRVARKGMASIWKARYEIYDENDNYLFLIQEDNGWIKVLDQMLGAIGAYFFNPSYSVTKEDGSVVFKLKKNRSVFGRHFTADKTAEIANDEEQSIILSLMMMLLLERRRG